MSLLTPTESPTTNETLTSLVYVSSATELFSPEALLDLLERARHNNRRLNITGMLLYKDGNFMQTLEGPDQPVRDLFETIKQDPRHRGTHRLFEQGISERQFSSWTMGFKNLEGLRPDQDAGYTDILNQPLNSDWFRTDPTRGQKLLLSFRKTM